MNILIKQFSSNYYIKKSDLFDEKLKNYMKSVFSTTVKGSSNGDNQDIAFSFENFLLIKNFSVFGVCDGHGKYGKSVVEAIKCIFPSYIHYLTMDNNLIKREEDINEIIISLFKLEERPDVKDMNIIRYFFKKFEMIREYIPIIKHNFNEIKRDITEAVYRTHLDLKERMNIDTENSGATMCTIFFYGTTIYVCNIGDSRAVMGSYIFEENRWETKQLSTDHKPENPNERKRIGILNGRVDKYKDETGNLIGPFRVWFKAQDSTGPGLAMSRSIGDTQAKKIGVIYDPDLFEYTLIDDNKFIIIGTDGLWDNIGNEEAVKLVGEYYEMKEKAENAAKALVEKARQTVIERNEKLGNNKKKDNGSNTSGNIGYQLGTNVNTSINVRSDDITCWVIFLDVKD